MEVWRQIEGASGYLVNNLGQVKNAQTDRILKPSKADGSYPRVHIKHDDGLYRTRYIHNIVDQVFTQEELYLFNEGESQLIRQPTPVKKRRRWVVQDDGSWKEF